MACALQRLLIILALLDCCYTLPTDALQRRDDAADVSAALVGVLASDLALTATSADSGKEPFERTGVIVPAVDPAQGAASVGTEKRKRNVKKQPGSIQINDLAIDGGNLTDAHDHWMVPESIEPATIIPFLEKCKADAHPKWAQNAPATNVYDTAHQFKFMADGLAFVVTGFDTALTGDYQLNWAQVEDICSYIIQKQTAAPRDKTYFGVLQNQAGVKDVTFILLAAYEVHDIGAAPRKSNFAYQIAPHPPIENPEICPGKRRLAKRAGEWTSCIQLPHSSWSIRWKHAGPMVAYTYLAAAAYQAVNQLNAEDRGIRYTDYSNFRAGILPHTELAGALPQIQNLVFQVVATAGQRILRDTIFIMASHFSNAAREQGWEVETSQKVVAAIIGEVVDQAGNVVANWAWGQPVPREGVTVLNPDGSTMTGLVERHDEL